METDQYIFHLPTCLCISTCIRFAKPLDVVIIVTSDNDWPLSQRSKQLAGMLFIQGRGRRIARIAFLLNTPNDVCSIFECSYNFSKMSAEPTSDCHRIEIADVPVFTNVRMSISLTTARGCSTFVPDSTSHKRSDLISRTHLELIIGGLD